VEPERRADGTEPAGPATTDVATPPPGVPREPWPRSAWLSVRGYFLDEDPTFWSAMVPMLVVSAVLFTRSLTTNFIFDEQEALLANPYVNGNGLGFWDAVHRDFWGLPHDRSVGSYRPLPDIVWRLIAMGLRGAHDLAAWVFHASGPAQLTPWVFHWCNVILHAANGALLTCLVFYVTRRRGLAWTAGAIFTACAVLTEAVCGVVGIADVLGGLGALLALGALRWPLWGMPLGVFGAMLVGLFSKESAIVCVPLVPLAALALAPNTHPRRPLRALRFSLAAVASVGAFLLYVSLRKRWFPSPLPSELLEPLPPGAGRLSHLLRAFLVWFHQPALPKDPLNNPFVTADVPHRVAGALRVYFRGLEQVVFPWTLSGDYSFPEEPVPNRLVFPESVLGGLAMVLPPVAALVLWVRALLVERRERRAAPDADPPPWATATTPMIAVALVWIVVSYFPHSNIPVLLPTVRAERFWYFPAIATSVLLACSFAWLWDRTRPKHGPAFAATLLGIFLAVQAGKARAHAFDYTDDLVFWRATRDAVPRSAKAHLNYSVMWGARGHLETRLEENRIALDLAPTWPMANVYLGDTLCRMHRPEEAWPHYRRGFELADNDPNLIALALQCLWDESDLLPHKDELLKLADQRPGSWLDYLAKDIVDNGVTHGGVDPKYRPRGYNEGPKD
jgi:hypothetical protein